MRKTFSALLLTALVGALMVPMTTAQAACKGTIGGMEAGPATTPAVGEGVIINITDVNNGPFYLDVRELAGADFIFSIWLYQETGKKAKLQRGGRSVMPDTPGTSGVETCIESTTPDLAIF